MQLPPVHSISASDYFVSGDVVIHETAVMAPGVILEAAPGCHIVVGSGVCIGLGCVILALAGDVVIEAEAALAPGVLVVGAVKIGRAACLGSRCTVFQQDIDAQALIPTGALVMAIAAPPVKPRACLKPLGKNHQNSHQLASHQAAELEASKASEESKAPESLPPIPSPWDSTDEDAPAAESVPQAVDPPESAPPPVASPAPVPTPEVTPLKPESPPEEPAAAKVPVVGQVYINQLLLTLFPERKFFNS